MYKRPFNIGHTQTNITNIPVVFFQHEGFQYRSTPFLFKMYNIVELNQLKCQRQYLTIQNTS